MATATVLVDKSNYVDKAFQTSLDSPVPSPDSQSMEKTTDTHSRKRAAEVFSYHKVGPKKLRKCNACGNIKVVAKAGCDPDAKCTSTSSDPDGISALDYMISECLVQKIDVPFKPLNGNIRGVLNSGTNKVSVLDIVELQIEKSFNMKSL